MSIRIASFITGEHYKSLRKADNASRHKVLVFAGLIMIPTLLWITTGYLLGTEFLKMGKPAALGLGIGVGFAIYLVERAIYGGNKSWSMLIFRVLLGGVIAFLGAVVLDTLLFAGDIQEKLNSNLDQQKLVEASSIDSSYNIQKEKQELAIAQAKSIWLQRVADYTREMEGLSNTGIVGVGTVAKEKEKLKNEAYEEYEAERNKLAALKDEAEVRKATRKQELEDQKSEAALLGRFLALKEVLSDNPSAFYLLYFPLFLFMLFLEMLLVVTKQLYPESAYEKQKDIESQIIKKNLQLRLQKVTQATDYDQKHSVENRNGKRLMRRQSSGVYA